MPNLNCKPVTSLITTHSATISGTADQIPNTQFIRLAYGVTPGGPYNVLGTNVPGNGSFGQTISEALDGLIPEVTYYFRVEHLDTDGLTILDASSECSFTTRGYNPRCSILSYNDTGAVVQICADFVSPDQTLSFVYGATLPGGPYPNTAGQTVGTDTLNQCVTFDLPLPECALIYGRARVDNVPALYEVDWSYAHAGLSIPNETVQLRIGPESDYPANQTLVDTDVAVVPDGSWNFKQGTYAIPLGVDTIHMGFVATNPLVGGTGNHIDACSIILRRVLPTAAVIGEQLVNGSFEVPEIGPATFQFMPEAPTTPGLAWQTTDACNCIELWSTGQSGRTAYPDGGDQWAELNAIDPSELFQVVPLAVGVVDSIEECSVARPGAECVDALNVTCDGAQLTGTLCGPANVFYSFEYATSPTGPWTAASMPQINPYGDTENQLPISASTGPLDPNTTYYFRVVLYDNNLHQVVISDPVCQFTTDDCLTWCGGYWDPETCEFVDTANDDYFNCWPEPIRNGFPGEGVEHS